MPPLSGGCGAGAASVAGSGVDTNVLQGLYLHDPPPGSVLNPSAL
jgi:hypothetical protein